MSRISAAVLFWVVGCGVPLRHETAAEPDKTIWHPVPQLPSPTQRGNVTIEAISPAQPTPGQRLLIRGTGFGEDRGRILVRIAARAGTQQRRAVWLRPEDVRQDVLELTVPAQFAGVGTLLVETQDGRSNVGTLQFQDARPQVLYVRMLPVETLVAVTGSPAGATATELMVDGRNMGTVREVGNGVYSGPGFLQWSGPHELVVLFSDGAESAPFRVENR